VSLGRIQSSLEKELLRRTQNYSERTAAWNLLRAVHEWENKNPA
jgi:hypothetical protein